MIFKVFVGLGLFELAEFILAHAIKLSNLDDFFGQLGFDNI